jgi:hypothetical protein
MAQIGPIVKFGFPHEVIGASVKSSYLWKDFIIWTLTENMRIQGTIANPHATEIELSRAQLEKQYAESLLDLARNRNSIHTIVLSELDEHTKILKLPLVDYFQTDTSKEALIWLYEGKSNDVTTF